MTAYHVPTMPERDAQLAAIHFALMMEQPLPRFTEVGGRALFGTIVVANYEAAKLGRMPPRFISEDDRLVRKARAQILLKDPKRRTRYELDFLCGRNWT